MLVGTMKLVWVAFTAWGSHSQRFPPGDPPALCGCFLVPGLADSRAVTEVGEGLQQLRRPHQFWLSNVESGAAVVVLAILPAAGAAAFKFLGVPDASKKILLMHVSSLKRGSWRRWDMWPLIAAIRFPAAKIMASSGVAVGFEIYLCLWKRVADTRVVRVFIIKIFHAW